MKAAILESKVICTQPGRYIGWPTIARTPGGELLAVFSGDRDAHVCPFGKTFLVRSGDEGESWSAPELVNNTPLDDRDTGILACRDGTVIVSWFTSHYTTEAYLARRKDDPALQRRWREALERVSMDDVKRWAEDRLVNGRYELGKWVRRSTDGGRTWEEPVRTGATTPHGPIELHDGRLLFLGIGGIDRAVATDGIVAAESCDAGRSWSIVGRVDSYPRYPGPAPDGYAYLCEPHVVEVQPGELLGLARYEEMPRPKDRTNSVLWQFTSDDGGRTWTKPVATNILGKPPHLLKLSDGRILATYGYRHEPYGQRACISLDGGGTWDYRHELILRDDAPSGDLGYPASVELPDGRILTVYYQQLRRGEMTLLMTTLWRIED